MYVLRQRNKLSLSMFHSHVTSITFSVKFGKEIKFECASGQVKTKLIINVYYSASL